MKKHVIEILKFVGMVGGGAILAGVILSVVATIVMFWMQALVGWGWIN